MSNFGVTYLLKLYKGNNRLSIEDNIGEELHIHFGEMRLMMRNAEFREFASHSLEYISDITGVSTEDLNRLDPIFLLDLCRRGELPSLTFQNEDYVRLGDLLCPVRNRLGIWRFKPISKSHFVKVMQRKTVVTPFDEDQVNYLGKTNVDRCNDILDICRANKNICDSNPLYVTGKNIIRDGQHRAVALYILYGPDFKVKVQKMETTKSINNSRSFFEDSFIPACRQLLVNIVHLVRKRKTNSRHIKNEIEQYKQAICKEINGNVFHDLQIDKSLADEVYFVEADVAMFKYPVLIRKANSKKETIASILDKHGLKIIGGHKLEGVTFIYGLGHDHLIVDSAGCPVAFLQDKLSSYAMSVNSFMPYAPEIQRYLNGFDKIPETLVYSLRLLKCMFDKNGNGFKHNDIDYFDKHKYLLDDEFFTEEGLFEKIMFGYTDRMLKFLRGGGYETIIEDYRRFEY